jgi:5'-3' exonuclease
MDEISKLDRKKLYSMFHNMGDTKPITRTYNSDVLIVDGLNSFFRSFMATPTMNDNGLHVGGIIGFLQTIGSAIKTLRPTRVVIVFDGTGGSLKRRKIYPEYKENRRTKIRLNRTYEDLSTSEQEDKSLLTQLIRITDYLKILPVHQMAIDYVEADDTIAYCATDYFKNSERVYIMSTDRDFLQLVNNRVQVWSPTRKKLYGCAEILMEYGISCENFILYRTLTGDVSDNIDGINGAGDKTIIKCFPFLTENKIYTIDDIISHSQLNQKKYKLYSMVLKNVDILRRNYQLMQLSDTQIQSFTQLRINKILDDPLPIIDRIEFCRMLTQDKMTSNLPNHQTWIRETFGSLSSAVI